MAQRINPREVVKALGRVVDAATGRDIVSLGCVKGVEVGEGRLTVALELPPDSPPTSPAGEQLLRLAHEALEALNAGEVELHVAKPGAAGEAPDHQHGAGGHEHAHGDHQHTHGDYEHAAAAGGRPPAGGPGGRPAAGGMPGSAPGAAPRPNLTPGVKMTIAVASGKGGVGKSTVAANLAVALRMAGHSVGLMDTDVYGPSVPMLVGGHTDPQVVGGKIEPPVEHGVKIISMGYFLPKDDAVIWRGPMLHKTVQQFLGDVRWGNLDYLIIDLPPGTGDIQLSLCQTAELTGAVIVSTPQDLALTVASKAIAMFEKLRVPVLGIVENMSYHVCRECGHREEIFGHGGAREAAAKLGYAFLGEIPLDTRIRAQSDGGQPVALDANTPNGAAFRSIAEALEAELAKTGAEQEITIE